MKSFAIAGIYDLLVRIPTIHQDVNALVIVCREGINHFNGQIILTLEGDLIGIAIFTLVVRLIVKCIGLAIADDLRCNEIKLNFIKRN